MDRDGTVTREVGYVNHPSRLELIPGTAEAIRMLNEAGILAIITTNQAGVARGYFREEMIGMVHNRLEALLLEGDAHLDAIYYCPHHPSVGSPGYRVKCDCRKPAPGMIRSACQKFEIDLEKSYVVGDKNSDVAFAHSMGTKGVQVMTGYGLGEFEYGRQDWKAEPEYIAANLLEAVKWIISDIGLA
ncbi:MAG: D,D-heptose 1,7-bisphosphate phosphatase [Candidatus Wallbacteria bacterium HGW-Wallbacteria-1]|uniref:D,D-heptose 1,7-bisphosphate phosphatase n=1 Tax=Candidatus Wallbacteria bacterium HGW-Wallbacteria-1 TaxID=2013854 RepID=A0A2N1PVH8_9BACT|nr:MAG: D,D-heptose 1,7-bisphosphate phosphatase [Candidatus Wallbacteria bacterium HGW-Wallbacteria-1]